ncbi:MAG: ChbG/HpnK family deacetylase [Magnetospirillum gryphiswaldense]|nr:ChbG/HpnK family deacetylase [Magnetospirillum gryphiswaldense]
MSGSVEKTDQAVNHRPKITLCADDYGLAPGVSAAIRHLIALGRLQATGCMTGSPHWPDAANALKPLDGMADIGLHITLTDQKPVGPMPKLAPGGKLPSLGKLLKLSLSGKIDSAEIAAEIDRQINAFQAAFGRLPDFLDGHHHVHQLPGIGEAVIAAWKTRLGGRAWVRSCLEPSLGILTRRVSPLRALVISNLGRAFRRRLEQAGVPHNRSFRGVYDFSGKVPFDLLFRRFTDNPGPDCLMMVHPGQVDDELRAADGLTSQREVEYRFLASEACVLGLAERGIALSRLFPKPL